MTEPSDPVAGPLPAAVRQRVVGWAASALGGMSADEVPAMLKAVARFTPAKRARSGAGPLAAALEGDPLFRQRVASWVRTDLADLARAVESGQPVPAADPAEVAALAYVLRPTGWAALVAGAAEHLDHAARTAGHARTRDELAKLQAELEEVRAQGRAAVEAAKAEAAREAEAAATARRRLRDSEAELGRLRAGAEAAAAAVERATAEARGLVQAAEAETRRLRARLAESEAALEAARRAAREGRNADSVRLRLLMDTVVEATHGLRRELALPPMPDRHGGADRPADAVAAASAVTPDAAGVDDLAVRGLAADDPALLDQLLDLPQVHLVVDGYNVTKTGYGTLALAEQRNRLVGGLAALAGRTRAEVTCVFDGTTLDVRVVQASPRGVRVLFSPQGQTADELIRRLVRAEPPGRPVVVVSSDREVADGVRAAGARPVPSSVLLRRLERS